MYRVTHDLNLNITDLLLKVVQSNVDSVLLDKTQRSHDKTSACDDLGLEWVKTWLFTIILKLRLL